MATVDEILEHWFGPLDAEGNPTEDRADLWWRADPATDDALRQRYEQDVLDAAAGSRDHWSETPEGTLALLILLDQLPRNIYRGTPRAFAQDSRARYLALQGIEAGQDRALPPIQRVFFYLPLEHAEDPALQRRSVELFAQLHGSAAARQRDTYRNYLAYAERHRAVIERFGRFPHRNALVGRASTPEERAFLAGPDAPF